MGEQESLCPDGKVYEQISIPRYILEHNFTENSRRKHHWQSQPGNERQGGGRGCISSVPLNDLQEIGLEVV